MFINQSFTITISTNSLIFNKDVVERLGEIPTQFFKITEHPDGVLFTETTGSDYNTVQATHQDDGRLRINSTDLVKYIKEVMQIENTTSFKICPIFLDTHLQGKSYMNTFILKKDFILSQ